MRARALVATIVAALLATVVPQMLGAQRAPPPGPSLAEQYLAAGRLASAERELYAAAAAYPREPSHRGALARYLASRGQFTIADVLFREALRFGADTAPIARAMSRMMLYRPPSKRLRVPGVRRTTSAAVDEQIEGVETTVALERPSEDGAIARIQARGRAPLIVTFDASREGIQVASDDDPALDLKASGRGAGRSVRISEITIGERRMTSLDATVDPGLPRGEVRMGIDMIWRLRPIIDDRENTFTLPAAGRQITMTANSSHLPIVLLFPGLWLVPQPGMPPVLIESPEGRALLRGTRWQLNPATSTLIVER